MDASQIASPADVSGDQIRELTGEVRDLQRRVSALEQLGPHPIAELPPPPLPEIHVSSDAVPLIGRALLAISGAYLLRAATELRLLPPRSGVLLGIAYAGFWLWRATRVEKRLAARVTAITAVVMLAPLLWEAVMTLHAIPTWAAAGIIAIFSIAPYRRSDVAAISSAAGASIAFVLLIGTHDLLPFTMALLAIGAATDWAALTDRWVAALLADGAVAILIAMVARGLPEGYAPVSIGEALTLLAVLFAVFAAGAVVRSAVGQRTFTFYEIGQTAIAVMLSLGGVVYLTRASMPVGIFVLALSAPCYGIAFRKSNFTRNFQTYAAFGALLALAGAVLLFSGGLLIAVLSAFAVGISATAAGKIQVPVFLWIGLIVSGVASASGAGLFGAGGEFPRAAAAILTIAAVACYLKLSENGAPAIALPVAAAAVWPMVGLAASFGAGPVVLVLFALALGWGGTRRRRSELLWLCYAAMAVGAAKILLHDFSSERTTILVLSLVVYGMALILLPRIVAAKQG